jgi:hypothetical protein
VGGVKDICAVPSSGYFSVVGLDRYLRYLPTSVPDPDHFNTDTGPDPAFQFGTDPDPAFHFDPDPTI